MKNRYLALAFSAFIFSIIAIIIAAINVPVVITHETFVGTIATFMGLCATFMVGYQIFSILSINDKLKEIEETSKCLDKKITEINLKTTEIDEKTTNLNKLYKEVDININFLTFHIAFAKGLAFEMNQPQTALICYLEALLVVLDENLFDYEIGYRDILHNIRKIVNQKNHSINLIADNAGLEIKENLNKITTHENYPRLQAEFMFARISLLTFLKINGVK
ncbi:MAG: hypothetical protein RR303_07590 [Bacteroidales bacterium]